MSDEQLTRLETALTNLAGATEDQFSRVASRFGGIDARLDGVDSRLDGVDSRLAGIDSRLDGIDSRLNGIDSRLGRVEQGHDGMRADLHKLSVLHEDTRQQVKLIWDALAATNERMDRRFDSVDRRFDGLERLMRSFIDTQGGINRELSDRDSDHARRIAALEQRAGE